MLKHKNHKEAETQWRNEEKLVRTLIEESQKTETLAVQVKQLQTEL